MSEGIKCLFAFGLDQREIEVEMVGRESMFIYCIEDNAALKPIRVLPFFIQV